MTLHTITTANTRRITAAVVILLGLITLHYFYSDQLPQFTSIISLNTSALATDSSEPPSAAAAAAPAAVFAGTITAQRQPSLTPTPNQAKPAASSWTITPFPEKHWQSWRVDPVAFEDQERERVLSWREKNPSWRYELLSDSVSESFVNESYPLRPDVMGTFHAMSDKITRADFLRYLILHSKGGVYSDIDTKALKPVAQWIPHRHAGAVNVVIGLEIDEPTAMWGDWADNFCFCQSTMLASPGHPIFTIVIADIVRKYGALAVAQKTDVSGVVLSFQDVLRVTGPVAFTDAVFAYLSEATGTVVGRANFSGINAPKRMADVLVLPTVAFVPGQVHSNSGKPEDAGALVQHLGMGSWRDAHAFDQDKDKKPEDEKKGG